MPTHTYPSLPLLSLFLSLNLILILPFSSRSFAAADCIPYSLQNECSFVVGHRVSSLLPQALLFDSFLALPISDVRMVPALCRRAFIWYLCHLAFPSCESDGGTCVISDEACDLAVTECDSYFNVTQFVQCAQGEDRRRSKFSTSLFSSHSSFSPAHDTSFGAQFLRSAISPVCFDNLTVDYLEETSIPVTTCITNIPNTSVSCCPTPFVMASNGECVLPCMQYVFGADKENAWADAALAMVWAGTVIYGVGLAPNLALTRWWAYPSVVIHCAEVSVLLLSHTMVWGCYQGTQDFVCGSGINDFMQAYFYVFLPSSKCIAQSFFDSFFTLSIVVWLSVLSFSTVVLAYRYADLDLFSLLSHFALSSSEMITHFWRHVLQRKSHIDTLFFCICFAG